MAAHTQLRNKKGQLIGFLTERNEILAKNGKLLGKYDPRSNKTFDEFGRLVGYGDIRTSLLKDE